MPINCFFKLLVIVLLAAGLAISVACGSDNVHEDQPNQDLNVGEEDDDLEQNDLEQDDLEQDDLVMLNSEGGICLNVQYPWYSSGGASAGTNTIYLYVDNTMVDGNDSIFSGECQASVDGDDIFIDNEVFVAESDSEATADAQSPYSVECGEVQLEAKTYTVHVGEAQYEFPIPEEGVPTTVPPDRTECVGVGEQETDENTGTICVSESDSAKTQLRAVHEIGGTSCVDDYQLECEFDVLDGEITVSTVGTYRSYHHIGDCTMDIGSVSTDCGELDLDDSSYQLNYGGDVLDFELPLDDEICGP